MRDDDRAADGPVFRGARALLLCAAQGGEGAYRDTRRRSGCAAGSWRRWGLLTTLALPRLLPMDSLVMALTNFLCGVGVVVLSPVSPERGARRAMFYAMGLAAMLVMSEIVFHVRHFRGLTLLGMALGIRRADPAAGLRRMEQRREELGVHVPLLAFVSSPAKSWKLSVVLALACFFSAHPEPSGR
ncbi:MAG: hypothetical protein ACLUHE_15780 [Christensenellales bacterium]